MWEEGDAAKGEGDERNHGERGGGRSTRGGGNSRQQKGGKGWDDGRQADPQEKEEGGMENREKRGSSLERGLAGETSRGRQGRRWIGGGRRCGSPVAAAVAALRRRRHEGGLAVRHSGGGGNDGGNMIMCSGSSGGNVRVVGARSGSGSGGTDV